MQINYSVLARLTMTGDAFIFGFEHSTLYSSSILPSALLPYISVRMATMVQEGSDVHAFTKR